MSATNLASVDRARQPVLRSFAQALAIELNRVRAGKPTVRFHDLRHTCATMLLRDDVSAKVVSARRGHASIEITFNV